MSWSKSISHSLCVCPRQWCISHTFFFQTFAWDKKHNSSIEPLCLEALCHWIVPILCWVFVCVFVCVWTKSRQTSVISGHCLWENLAGHLQSAFRWTLGLTQQWGYWANTESMCSTVKTLFLSPWDTLFHHITILIVIFCLENHAPWQLLVMSGKNAVSVAFWTIQ